MKRIKSIGELVVFVDAAGTQKTYLAIISGYEKDNAKPLGEQLYYKLKVDSGIIRGKTVEYQEVLAPQAFVYSLAEYHAFIGKYGKGESDNTVED